MLKGENYTNQLYESYASRLAINTMINGECGIIDNYGNKMEVTYNNNIVTISNGMAVVKGGLIRETTYTTLNATLTDGLYYSVVLEIDLSQTNTRQEFNQGSFKLLSNNGSYPTLQQDDISLNTNSGIYQMELARFQTSASAITNFADTRKILSYNSLIQELRSAISKVISEDLSAGDIQYDENTTVKQKIDTMQSAVNNISPYEALDKIKDKYKVTSTDISGRTSRYNYDNNKNEVLAQNNFWFDLQGRVNLSGYYPIALVGVRSGAREYKYDYRYGYLSDQASGYCYAHYIYLNPDNESKNASDLPKATVLILWVKIKP